MTANTTAADGGRGRLLLAILGDALAEPADGRARFVTRACAQHPELADELRALVDSYERAEGFLEAPAAIPPDTWTNVRLAGTAAAGAVEGVRIGPYEVVRSLGSGGMGTVYLAERADDAFDKRVAIKVVAGALARPELVERLLVERRILASLEHPHIARLLDAGTLASDGTPYLVMEYVDGEPIDAYCQRRGLPVAGRLRLFLDVCAAVHYLHQNLVIHRDLKPHNTLVTADGRVKLLDFGVAKLLDDQPLTEATSASERLLSLQYASPEQVEGARTTTATDVYMLGVLLHRMLTGASPYRSTAPTPVTPVAMARAICEDEPEPPSATLARVDGIDRRYRAATAGDVDAIVLKALWKDPARRYGSAEQLADDITRHLEGRPVLARPGTATYRAGRFLRRYAAASAGIATLIVSLVGGIVATRQQAAVARANQARADRRFNEVRTLARGVLFDLHDEVAPLPGSAKARQYIVDASLTYLDSLSIEASDNLSLRYDLSRAYRRVADLLGAPGSPNLSDAIRADANYERSLALQASVLASDPQHAEARRSLGITRRSLAEVRDGAFARPSQAMALASRAVDDQDRLRAEQPGRTELWRDLGWSLLTLARIEDRLGRAGAAERALSRLGDVLEHLDAERAAMDPYLAATDGELRVYHLLAQADLASRSGRLTHALTRGRDAVARARAVAKNGPTNVYRLMPLMSALTRTARIELRARDIVAAQTLAREAVASAETLSATDPNAFWLETEAEARGVMAEAARAANRSVETAQHLDRAIALQRRVVGSDSANLESQTLLGWLLVERASLTAGGDARADAPADADIEEALRYLEGVATADPGNLSARLDLASALGVAGRLTSAGRSPTSGCSARARSAELIGIMPTPPPPSRFRGAPPASPC